MNEPTPDDTMYAWHRSALLDDRTPRYEGEPQPGWYRRRMVKNGPWVPVRIFLTQDVDPDTGKLQSDEVLAAETNGAPSNPIWIWTYCQPISQEDYDALVDLHRTDAEMAATHASIDLSLKPTRPGA